MTSKKLLNKIRFKGFLMLFFGGNIFLFIIGYLITEGTYDLLPNIFSSLPLFFVGIVLVVVGSIKFFTPQNTATIQNNPDLLKMLDELQNNIVYEDSLITVSDKIILCKKKKKPQKTIYLKDIIYIYIQDYYLDARILCKKQLVLVTVRGEVRIDIYGINKALVNKLYSCIILMCPNIQPYYYEGDYIYYMPTRESNYSNKFQYKDDIACVTLNRGIVAHIFNNYSQCCYSQNNV